MSLQKILAFCHLERTAGMTVAYALRKRYFLRSWDARPITSIGRRMLVDQDVMTFMRINPRLQCIYGHSISPCYLGLEGRIKYCYVTVLRDPIERYVSHYYKWRQIQRGPTSFLDYAKIIGLHNLMTRRFSQKTDCNEALECLKRFDLVGMQDELNHFMANLFALTGSKMPGAFHATKNNAARRAIGRNEDGYDEMIKISREVNGEDVRLYEMARKAFNIVANDDILRIINDNGACRHASKLYFDAAYRKLITQGYTTARRLARGMPMYGWYGTNESSDGL